MSDSNNMIFIKGDDQQMDKIAQTLKHLPLWIDQKRYLRDMGVLVLRFNRQRIADQQMADGSQMPARKNLDKLKNKVKSKRGGQQRVEEQMFKKLRLRKSYHVVPIRSKAGEKFVKIKFKKPYLEKIARFHQTGISQTIRDKKTGKSWKIPRTNRDILVINDDAKEHVMQFLDTRLEPAIKEGR